MFLSCPVFLGLTFESATGEDASLVSKISKGQRSGLLYDIRRRSWRAREITANSELGKLGDNERSAYFPRIVGATIQMAAFTPGEHGNEQ